MNYLKAIAIALMLCTTAYAEVKEYRVLDDTLHLIGDDEVRYFGEYGRKLNFVWKAPMTDNYETYDCTKSKLFLGRSILVPDKCKRFKNKTWSYPLTVSWYSVEKTDSRYRLRATAKLVWRSRACYAAGCDDSVDTLYKKIPLKVDSVGDIVIYKKDIVQGAELYLVVTTRVEDMWTAEQKEAHRQAQVRVREEEMAAKAKEMAAKAAEKMPRSMYCANLKGVLAKYPEDTRKVETAKRYLRKEGTLEVCLTYLERQRQQLRRCQETYGPDSDVCF